MTRHLESTMFTPPQLPPDLAQHFFYGALLGLAGALLALWLRPPLAWAGALLLAGGLGLVWELMQRAQKTGVASARDWAVTTAAGGVVALPLWLALSA